MGTLKPKGEEATCLKLHSESEAERIQTRAVAPTAPSLGSAESAVRDPAGDWPGSRERRRRGLCPRGADARRATGDHGRYHAVRRRGGAAVAALRSGRGSRLPSSSPQVAGIPFSARDRRSQRKEENPPWLWAHPCSSHVEAWNPNSCERGSRQASVLTPVWGIRTGGPYRPVSSPALAEAASSRGLDVGLHLSPSYRRA